MDLLSTYTLLNLVTEKLGMDPSNLGSTERKLSIDHAKESFDAVAFLCGLNAQHYQGLLDELSDAYLNGRNEYPQTLVAAYKLVTNWKGESTLLPLKPDSGVTFTQAGSKEQTTDATINVAKGKLKRQDSSNVVCHIYSAKHYADECPKGEH